MSKAKKFTCKGCGVVNEVVGGTSNYHCLTCRTALGMRDLSTPKYLAHQAVAKARKQGLLADPRTLMCSDCEAQAIEYDHRDYSQPLVVSAVCRRCNLKRGPAAGQWGEEVPEKRVWQMRLLKPRWFRKAKPQVAA